MHVIPLTAPLNHRRDRDRPRRKYRIRDRVRLALKAHRLDRALAAGTPEDTSPALALRAQTLVSPEVGDALGDQLRRIVRDVDQPPGGAKMRIEPSREQVLAAEQDLRRLASRLQSPRRSKAAGVAKVMLLLTDGTGPLYDRSTGTSLSGAVREARAALG